MSLDKNFLHIQKVTEVLLGRIRRKRDEQFKNMALQNTVKVADILYQEKIKFKIVRSTFTMENWASTGMDFVT